MRRGWGIGCLSMGLLVGNEVLCWLRRFCLSRGVRRGSGLRGCGLGRGKKGEVVNEDGGGEEEDEESGLEKMALGISSKWIGL